MAREVMEGLLPKAGGTIVDCTIGCGGHAKLILEKILPGGRLIGLDVDECALKEARQALKHFNPESFILKKANFADIGTVFSELGIEKIDGALFDLGVSSLQLDDAGRGFSIQREGPLDMRMDASQRLSAFDIINRLKEEDLYRIIKDYGEERHARRIARFIVSERKKKKISGTAELAALVAKALGGKRARRKIHPATRTFQAVRIAVNGELDALKTGLEAALSFLNPGARICAISFHSLEDRIVKNIFKENFAKGALKLLTKKPLRPGTEEIVSNPRSRSAKLRIAESKGG